VGIMDELDMVRDSMNPNPSDRFVVFSSGSKFLYLGLSIRGSTNHLRVAEHALLYRWNGSGRALVDVPMAKRARQSNTTVFDSACVHSVWERYRLLWTIGPYRQTKPRTTNEID